MRNLRALRVNLSDVQYFEESRYIGCFSCHETPGAKSLACDGNGYSKKGKLKLIKIEESTLEEFRAKAREARLQEIENPGRLGSSSHQKIMNELRSVNDFGLSWGYNFKFDFLTNYYEFSPNGKKIAFLVDNKTIYTFDFEKLASSAAGGVVPQKKSIDLDAHEAKYEIESPS